MKTLIWAAFAASFAVPAWAEIKSLDMYILRATLCLQTSKTDAECRVEIHGPYANPKECKVRGDILHTAAREQAEAGKAKVLFLSTICKQGRDT